MKKLLVGIIILVVLVVASLSYIGFMPYLSGFIAKQVDLGIKVDPSFVEEFEAKYGSPSASGNVYLDVDLSSQDITSIFATWEKRDKFFPLHSVQVRFNPDGTGEASGFLKISTAISLAKNLGYSDTDIEKGKKYVQYVAGDLPFYVKGKGGMNSNVLSIEPSTFQLGRVTVPNSITTPAASAVSDMVKRRIDQIGGADIKVADFKSGSFRLVGTVPATIEY